MKKTTLVGVLFLIFCQTLLAQERSDAFVQEWRPLAKELASCEDGERIIELLDQLSVIGSKYHDRGIKAHHEKNYIDLCLVVIVARSKAAKKKVLEAYEKKHPNNHKKFLRKQTALVDKVLSRP